MAENLSRDREDLGREVQAQNARLATLQSQLQVKEDSLTELSRQASVAHFEEASYLHEFGQEVVVFRLASSNSMPYLSLWAMPTSECPISPPPFSPCREVNCSAKKLAFANKDSQDSVVLALKRSMALLWSGNHNLQGVFCCADFAISPIILLA